MKSGNTSSFRNMGSSPAKDEQPHKTTKDHKPHATFDYDGGNNNKETLKESELKSTQHAASDKVLYGKRHGSKLKDKTGWTKTPGTNTWSNDEYENIKLEKKAMKARYKID